MSVKIYNGYRIPYTSLLGLFEFFEEFKIEAEKAALRYMTRLVACQAAEKFDQTVLGVANYPNPISAAYNEIRTRQRKIIQTQERDPEVDLECMFNFYYYNDYVYLILHFERAIYPSILEANPLVEDYEYYTGVDRPNNVSKREWDKRGRIWEELLKAPLGSSVRFHAVPTDYYVVLKDDDIVQAVPNYDIRVKQAAIDMVNRMPPPKEYQGNGKNISHIMRWLNSDDYMTMVEQVKPYICSKLPLTLTKRDLLGFDRSD